jgi:hypothetical protein
MAVVPMRRIIHMRAVSTVIQKHENIFTYSQHTILLTKLLGFFWCWDTSASCINSSTYGYPKNLLCYSELLLWCEQREYIPYSLCALCSLIAHEKSTKLILLILEIFSQATSLWGSETGIKPTKLESSNWKFVGIG